MRARHFLVLFSVLALGIAQKTCSLDDECSSLDTTKPYCHEGACVECVSDEGKACVDSVKRICSAENVCVQCDDSNPCDDKSASQCVGGECVSCTEDAHCTHFGEGYTCDAGTCKAPAGCLTDEECSGLDTTKPYCHEGACVECVSDEGKACVDSVKRICSAENVCVQCDDSNPCDDKSASQCVGGECVSCTEDAHCTHFGEGYTCDAGTCKAPAGCLTDEECSGLDPTKPYCHEGACVECTSDDHCSEEPKTHCNEEHVCVEPVVSSSSSSSASSSSVSSSSVSSTSSSSSSDQSFVSSSSSSKDQYSSSSSSTSVPSTSSSSSSDQSFVSSSSSSKDQYSSSSSSGKMFSSTSSSSGKTSSSSPHSVTSGSMSSKPEVSSESSLSSEGSTNKTGSSSKSEEEGGLSATAIGLIVAACVVVVALAIGIPCFLANRKSSLGADAVEYETPEDAKQEIKLRSVSVL